MATPPPLQENSRTPAPGQVYLGPPPPVPAPPARPGKPFYKRWWFIALSVVFALAIVGSLAGPPTEDTTSASDIPPDPDGVVPEEAPAPVVEGTSEGDPEPQVTEEPVTDSEPSHQLGQEFRLGAFSYIVDGASTQAQIGNDVVNTSASQGATFVLVRYRIRNEGNRTETVLSDDFTLVDARGREFTASSDATSTLAMSGEDNDLILSELQPGIWRETVTAFEVPADATEGLTLVIPEKGFFGTGDARIPLSL